MSLPTIRTEKIQYDTEFHGYLYRNHNKNKEDLYALMEQKNFNFSELSGVKQRKIINIYCKFVNIKEHWFGAPKGLRHAKPVTSEAIDKWINEPGRIAFYGNTSDYGQNRDYQKTPDDIRWQAANRIGSILKGLAEELPEVVRTLVFKRKNFQFMIFPQDEIILKNVIINGKLIKEYRLQAGAAYDSCSDHLLLKEDSLFKGNGWLFNSTVRHELYHAFDFAAVDGVANSRRANYENRPMALSDVVNERLKEKKLTNKAVRTLDEIAAAESVKMKEFNRICSLYMRKAYLDAINFGDKDVFGNPVDKELNKEIERLKAEHQVWVPTTIQFVAKSREIKILCRDGGEDKLNGRELLAYGLEAYYNGSKAAALKKYNPALYDIIVNEVIPVLRDVG